MSKNDHSLDTGLSEAANALDSFAQGPAQEAADAIGDAFAKAGQRISSALGTAARTGELSVKGLASAILRDLSAVAIDKFVTAPLNGAIGGALGSVFKGLPSFGARASGGPVNPGGAYLVGERGPELFVPRTAGSIEAGGGGPPVTIHINMPQGSSLAEARRSSNQVAAALARAVRKGSGLL
jgi:phage-related minor tail protein